MHALIAQSVGVAIALGAAQQAARAQIIFGQIDDFQDGSTMNWIEGVPSPNQPVNVANGGPNGAGDRYLSDISSGGAGAGSKQLMFNDVRWTGDYNAADVTRATGMMANFGATTLSMRYALQGGAFVTQYASTNAIVIPPDGQWHAVTFIISNATMSDVNFGPDSLADVLAGVTEARILSNAAGPSWFGETIVSTLGMDNLRATTLAGDANHDRTIDTIDFNLLAANFGGTSKVWAQGDFNYDTLVDTVDFNLLASNFSQTVPAASTISTLVPEPGALLPVAFLAASLVARTRFR